MTKEIAKLKKGEVDEGTPEQNDQTGEDQKR